MKSFIKYKKFWKEIFIILFFIFDIFIFYVLFETRNSQILKVAFLDVGQGDAILIEAPNGNQLLIDAGQNRVVLSELGKTIPFFDRKIDAIIETHPDNDHIGGVIDVLKTYKVSEIFDSENNLNKTIDIEIKKEAELKKIEITHLTAGDIMDLGGGAFLEVLWPEKDFSLSKTKETNDFSIICRLVYGKTSFLFTGDASKDIENYIVSKYGQNIDSDVLKIGHHGSKNSSSEKFLSIVNPEYFVISVGADNKYGHPNNEVISLLKKLDGKILETMVSGKIVFTSNGETVKEH